MLRQAGRPWADTQRSPGYGVIPSSATEMFSFCVFLFSILKRASFFAAAQIRQESITHLDDRPPRLVIVLHTLKDFTSGKLFHFRETEGVQGPFKCTEKTATSPPFRSLPSRQLSRLFFIEPMTLQQPKQELKTGHLLNCLSKELFAFSEACIFQKEKLV